MSSSSSSHSPVSIPAWIWMPISASARNALAQRMACVAQGESCQRGQHRDVNTAGATSIVTSRAPYWARARARRDRHQNLARHGHADMLTIVEAVAAGILIGELVAGIPLSRRIARYERARRKPTLFPDVGDVDVDDTIIAEWPDDRAAAMLEAWRTELTRRDLHAMRRAADVDSGRLRRL
jgi:hypothetical protein